MAKKKPARFFLRSAVVRSEENNGKKYIVGIIPYNSRSVDFGGECYEVLAPGVFRETLDGGANVYALRNHNTDQILASTKAGTFRLEDSDTALVCTAELPPTAYAEDLFAIVQRGDCNTLSFGFCPEEVDYEQDGDGATIRTIKAASLEEVSFGVPFPAYPDSDVQAEMRSRKLAKPRRRSKKRDEDELDDEEERDDDELEDEERDDEPENEEERDDDELDDDEERDEEEDELDDEERDEDELDDEERDEDELDDEEERDEEEDELDDEEERKRRSRRRSLRLKREAEAFLFLNRYKCK